MGSAEICREFFLNYRRIIMNVSDKRPLLCFSNMFFGFKDMSSVSGYALGLLHSNHNLMSFL